MKGETGVDEVVLQHVLQWMVRCGWRPFEEAAAAAQEQHARGLLKLEEREGFLRNWAFVTLERRFERYYKLGPWDIRHGITATGLCRGFEPETALVHYHVEPATAGRGFSSEGFVTLKGAEEAVAQWERECGLALEGLALRVEPIVHVAHCDGCGKEAEREAIRATLQTPWGRRFTREYWATLAKARKGKGEGG